MSVCVRRALFVAVVVFLSTTLARAELYGAPPPNSERRFRFEGDWGFEGFNAWMPHTPRLMLQGSAAPRDLVGLTIPDQPARFVGVGAEFRAYGLPIPGSIMSLLRVRYANAAGTLPAAIERADGEPVWVQTESMHLLEFGLPYWNGMAFSDAENRFRVAALLDMGAAYAWGSALIRTSRGTSEQSMHRFDLYIHTEIDPCARPLDSLWLCVALSGNVHDFGWLNGGSVGLRLELVP